MNLPRAKSLAFALTVVRHTLQGTLYEENGGRLDSEHLVAELVRMIKGYLGVR